MDVPEKTALPQVIKDIEQTYGLKFSFNPRALSQYEFQGKLNADRPEELIDQLLTGLPLKHKKAGQVMLIIPDPKKQSEIPKIKGRVVDGVNGQPLAFALVNSSTNTGTLSNQEGAFQIIPSRDSLEITIRHIGYKPRTLKLGADPRNIAIRLEPDPQVLPDFILDGSIKDREAHEISQFTINPSQINSLPTLGEPDLFKSLQLLPGIQATDESSSGMIVRGSTADQNLVLMDGFTLYHLDHFLGIFSTFNPNTINQVDLYKGGFSAQYGGRISSVLDARGKDAGREGVHGGVGLSVTSVNGFLETPIAKNLNWLVGGRFSQNLIASAFYDQFLDDNRVDILQSLEPGVAPKDVELDPSFGFYDFTSKLRLDLNDRSYIDFNVYLSEDDYLGVFDEEETFAAFTYRDEATWSNLGTSLVWSQQFNDQYQSQLSVSGSGYDSYSQSLQGGEFLDFNLDSLTEEIFDELTEEELALLGDSVAYEFGLEKENSITDFSMNWKNDIYLNDFSSFVGGVSLSLYEADYTLTYIDDEDEFPDSFSQDAGLWSLFGEFVLNPGKWEGRLGLRYNEFELASRRDLEPRLAVKYFINDRLQLKASWSKHHQYVNRISVSPFGNSDQFYWVLSEDEGFPVLEANHLIGGLEWQRGNWVVDTEGYYKVSSGITESEFVLFRRDINFEEESDLIGKNFSSGIDAFIKYREDRFSSWLSYSLSYSQNQIPAILDNDRYWSAVDQRHEINQVNMFKLGKWEFSSVFIFGSGKPYTPAPEDFDIEDPLLFDVDRINTERLPTYHRLDLGAKYTTDFGKGQLETGITLFNVYNRKNIKSRTFTAIPDFDVERDEELFEATPVNIRLLGLTPNIFVNLRF